MNTKLKDQLQEWDGKHKNFMEKIYYDRYQEANFFSDLTELCLNHPETRVAATWLIKHHYDNKKSLPYELIDPLLKAGKDFEHWEAQLHILQILPKIKMKEEVVPYVEELARKGLNSHNKFVRAWSYQGLYEVSKSIPEMTEEVRLLCEQAMVVESASVKARVRKVLNLLL